jgi:hypothetical protein
MSIGEIIDTSFRVLRSHFVPLVGISAIVNVPVSVGQALVGQQAEGGSPASVPALAIGLGLLSFTFVAPIVSAAVTSMVGEVYVGRAAKIGEAFRVALRMVLPLIGTSLLAGLAMMVGFLLLIVPGVWLGLGLIALTPVMVIERSFGMKAIERSLELLSGNRGRAFLLYLLVGILMTVLSTTFALLAGAAPVLGGIASGLASSVTGAFLAVVSVTLYFEIRSRKEAFEIDQLAEMVGAAARTAPAVGS